MTSEQFQNTTCGVSNGLAKTSKGLLLSILVQFFARGIYDFAVVLVLSRSDARREHGDVVRCFSGSTSVHVLYGRRSAIWTDIVPPCGSFDIIYQNQVSSPFLD